MRIPYKIHFYERPEVIRAGEWARLPSGKIVVMTEEDKGYPESYWFDSKGKNPKSYIEFLYVSPPAEEKLAEEE